MDRSGKHKDSSKMVWLPRTVEKMGKDKTKKKKKGVKKEDPESTSDRLVVLCEKAIRNQCKDHEEL